MVLLGKEQLPSHVAIAMDGNGRWATKRGLSRLDGHRQGAKVALDIARHCGERGIPYLTLWAFSSENWQRPQEEVIGLMEILRGYLSKETDELIKNGVALHTIGAIDKLPASVQIALNKVRTETRGGKNLHLTLALSYGGREEIVRATKQIADDVAQKRLEPSAIDEKLISSYLDTKDIPDPDLLIRTSGEMRLSNFLLWQTSYTELFFTNVLWPDFLRTDFDAAIAEFQGRQRRFGKISEQLNETGTY